MIPAEHVHWLLFLLEILSALPVLVAGGVALAIAVMAVVDISQRRDAIRPNHRVIGRFRAPFEHLGRFFRQYFSALDREELPFNRAERTWVCRAAEGRRPVAAFGSTRDLRRPGAVFFVNAPFPASACDSVCTRPLVVGPHCPRPCEPAGFFRISGMSYGAISRPAVQALSRGARMAVCRPSAGEGGPVPCHLAGGCDPVFQIGTTRHVVRGTDGRPAPVALRRHHARITPREGRSVPVEALSPYPDVRPAAPSPAGPAAG